MWSSQGTKIGPLCFLLLISDGLTNTPHIHRWKYVGVPINNRDQDYSALQTTQEQLQAWSENRITINHSKNVSVPPPQLPVGPHHLLVGRSAKLLGVTVDDQLICED